MFLKLIKPRIFKVVKDDEDVRIANSDRYERYRVEYNPSGDFRSSMFSETDVNEMMFRQCFALGTILVDIDSNERYEVSGDNKETKSRNGKIVREPQFLRKL